MNACRVGHEQHTGPAQKLVKQGITSGSSLL